MNLKKMDPIARKLSQHTEAFTKALEDGNANDAQLHLNEVKKFAEYLSEDIHAAIVKTDNPIETVAPGEGSVMKFQTAGTSPAGVVSGNTLPGFISSGRHNKAFKPASGTFGRSIMQGE